MIEHIDNLLRHLFLSEIDEIMDETQVRFQPPDDIWRSYVSSLTVKGEHANALNVYLCDVRENRKLRSNERIREFDNQTINETTAPRRIDCHYIISAWSPALLTPLIEPTLEEHTLLYKVTNTLLNNESLVPRTIYDPDPLPATFPEIIADEELPMSVVIAEGFPKLAEFWGTVNWHWKPSLYLIITLPVVLVKNIAGPMVTTRITEYRSSRNAEVVDTIIQIGGHILVRSNAKPIEGAWVRLEDTSGVQVAVIITENDGRFTFTRLQQGTYILRVRAEGFAETTRSIHVPSTTGEYDIELT